ncbi:peptide MFS transporter [Altererythrobacter sp.]|uniref:peptide MFS transporter n=1 Tax=Altererythrobacter sp. TaxID=1872480 RepID=UPI003CFF6DB2
MSNTGATADSGGWMGHPKGLFFLAFTEMWERFSFYGMRALLVLYMVQDLLMSDRVEKVAGMAAFRDALEAAFGPMSTQAFASQTFGLYAGFVYFTPLFGGLMADRWLGAKKVVVIGIALMTAGHFAMVFDWSFLIALVLLVLGSGCLKGNIAAQVGHLYPKAEEALRSSGYTLFSTGINIGAILGPVVCGALAQVYGWHVGFGTAGAVMLVAAAVYFSGMRHFADHRSSMPEREHAAMSRQDWRMLLLVILVIAMLLFQFLAYDQMSNVGMIWVASHVDLATPFGVVPTPWFAAEDAMASVVIVPFLIALWRWQASRGTEPGDLGKMAIGGLVMSGAALALAAGAYTVEDGGKASAAWPLLAYFLSGVSFMWSWPNALALVSRRAPLSINALMMAGAYLIVFFSSTGSGFIARWYEPLGPMYFWLLNAGIALFGSLCFVMFGPLIKGRMDELDASAVP